MKNLSEREQQILGLAAAGFIDKNIATELNISVNTLRTYWHRIRQKTGNMTRGALTAALVKGELKEASFRDPDSLVQAGAPDRDDLAALRQSLIYYKTENQRLQTTLRQTDRACRVFAAYPRMCMDIFDEQKLLSSFCELLVEIGGYVMAWIGTVNHNEAKSIEVVASSGDVSGYLEGILVSWDDGPSGSGPAGTAVKTNEIQVNRDFLANPKMLPWRQRAMRSGFQSSIGIPMSNEGAVFAVISVYAVEAAGFDDIERRLLSHLAEDLSRQVLHLRDRNRQ